VIGMGDQESFAFEAAAPKRPAQSTSKGTGAPKQRPRQTKARKSTPRNRSAPPSRMTAKEMAGRQRDISVSEFFAKNRHLLGFDNPSKALLTTVKEGVDNSLDACEEAGVVPDIRVEIVQLDENRFRVAVEDNGPGIVRAQVPSQNTPMPAAITASKGNSNGTSIGCRRRRVSGSLMRGS
jgi:hypothetical protein